MDAFIPELLPIDTLVPHPRNYREHPEDQRKHLMQSIRDYGIYRNIVVARDNTILAGHGLVEAAAALGVAILPVLRLPLAPDDPRALKLLISDNETGHLAIRDDRLLTELLKELYEQPRVGLLGTGFDETMLAGLTYVTRPASEIETKDHASQWVGLPEYVSHGQPYRLILQFHTESARQAYMDSQGLEGTAVSEHTISLWYPPQSREDPGSLRFESAPTL